MKAFLLIGLGRFGKSIAIQLHQLGHQVMAVDHREELVNDILPFVTSAQIGDSTNMDFLASLGVKNYDVCIVAIGSDFQSSLETTANLKELGARLVVSRAARDAQAKFLLRNGADDILYPEKQFAKWTAIRYGSNHIFDYIEVDWVGHSVGQIDIRKRFNINIMATKHDGKMDVSVTPSTVLTEDRTMLVLGEYKALQKCFHI